MDLKTETVGSCDLCGRTGTLNGDLCSCTLKFRALNRMVDRGFNRSTLRYVSGEYRLPEIETGSEYLDYYQESPVEVERKGLSLYIHSREKGRGKTTLAHRLVYLTARYFAHTSRYKRIRNYGFERVDRFLSNRVDGVWRSSFYVLDDLGAEDSSAQWTRQKSLSVLQELLHYRRDHGLSTVITSNYRPEDLSALYGGVLDSLLEIAPDGALGGSVFRQVEVGGGEDFRLSTEDSAWPL